MAGSEDTRARTRAKAWAADFNAARRRAGFLLPDWLSLPAGRLRLLLSQWVLAELAPGRLLPWLPVAYGFGIVGYFAVEREPAWWAALAVTLAAVIAAILAHRRPIGFPLALAFAAIAAGFATATLKTLRIAHPVLPYPSWSATVAGFVESREERERSDRIVVRVAAIEARNMSIKPERVRVAVRKGTAPAVGSVVAFKAHLSPPLAPLRPGGYDFARDMYFLAIGASGYVLGRISTANLPMSGGLWLRYAAFLDDLRGAIDQRIRAVASGDRGAIASALITGTRDAISTQVNDAMYVSSLAHVLSISGYHMAVVAGIVFFFIRAALALIPGFAVRHPIKKWAAACALLATAFYLLLSGAEVATQRSFIMIALVLIGVMADRPALTFRTLAVAAFAVLLLTPQAAVQPSFQMSFAATLALIAAYQNGLPWQPNSDSTLSQRAALWGAREIVGLILASLVAGLATTPYAAFHFHRMAPYGVLANLLAIPIVSAWVMPMGILGVLALPFGFDAEFWRLMGSGIDWMTSVALWVANLPGAVGHVRAFGAEPLLLATAGLLSLCLLHTPLRWSGVALVLAAGLWAIGAPRPDVLISADGRAAVIRGPDGRLSVLSSGRDTFAIREWLAADGDARDPKDASLRADVSCDAIGCTGKLANGRLASMALKVEAFAEDCMRAVVVVSPHEAPASCAATLIDRKVSRAYGAIALRWSGDRFQASLARPPGTDRPWAPAPHRAGISAQSPSPLRDATPQPHDLEPGD
jgi:competence protein ComEC